MTGFARIEGGQGNLHWALEAKSVNGKALELRCRLPPSFEALEGQLRQAAQKALTRGNIQVNLQLDRGETRARLTVNQVVLDELLALTRRLQSEGAAPPSADGLLALKGVLESQEEADDPEALAARERALAGDHPEHQ